MTPQMNSPHNDGAIDRWQAVLPANVRTPLLRFYSEAELDALSVSLARPPRQSCVRANTRVASADQLAQQVWDSLHFPLSGAIESLKQASGDLHRLV